MFSGTDKIFVVSYKVPNVFVVAPAAMLPARISLSKATEVVIEDTTLAQIGVDESTIIVLSIYNCLIVYIGS